MLRSVRLSVYPNTIISKRCILWLRLLWNTNSKTHAGSRTHWSSWQYGHWKYRKRAGHVVMPPPGRYLVTPPPVRVSKYCNEPVCLYPFCLSATISPEIHVRFSPFFAHVNCTGGTRYFNTRYSDIRETQLRSQSSDIYVYRLLYNSGLLSYRYPASDVNKDWTFKDKD